MKYSHLILGLTIVCLLFSAIACGPREPIVETPAGEINFTAAELGDDWTLQEEQGVDTIMAEVPGHILDANQRTFLSGELTIGVITSMVLSTKSVSSAQREMSEMGKATGTLGIRAALHDMLPDATLQDAEAPAIGDEATLLTAKDPGQGINAFVLTFRKSNVICMLFLVGGEEFATEETAAEYSRKLEVKIQ